MTPRAKINILLVEDNPGDARLFCEMLREAAGLECRLVHVERVETAIAQLRESEFDLVLLDLSLPDGHGIDTVKRVKESAADVPIIVLTGVEDEQLAISAVQTGAQDYLIKGETESASLLRAARYAIERKRAAWIERERSALQESVRGMDEALGVIAHELRTPLTALRMTAELMLTDAMEDAATTERLLQSVHSEVLRMSDMVSDILEAARIESGAARWRWSLVRLHKVCGDAFDVVRPLLYGKPIELRSEVDPQLTFNGDPDAIRRLLVNLVSNAIKHTRQGSITVSCAEMWRDEARHVAIGVRDTGKGIPESIASKLGTAFALNRGVVGAADAGGTGLGLAICKGIAAAHGGRISINSVLGQGSTFTAILKADTPTPAKVTDDLPIHLEVAA